jgi:hypothetical protein
MSKPWSNWEDYSAGLYHPNYTAAHVADATHMLSNPDEFREVAREMIRAWPVSAIQNLCHMWSGRNAWVGQASALYAYRAPGAATREAWGALTPDQQRAANATAADVRAEWERDYVGQTLFDV